MTSRAPPSHAASARRAIRALKRHIYHEPRPLTKNQDEGFKDGRSYKSDELKKGGHACPGRRPLVQRRPMENLLRV